MGGEGVPEDKAAITDKRGGGGGSKRRVAAGGEKKKIFELCNSAQG